MSDNRQDLLVQLMREAEARDKREQLRNIFGDQQLAELEQYQKQRQEEAFSVGEKLDAHLDRYVVPELQLPVAEAEMPAPTVRPQKVLDWTMVGALKTVGEVTQTGLDYAAQAAGSMESVLALPHQLEALRRTDGLGTDILAEKVANRTGENKEDVWPMANDYLKSWVRAEAARTLGPMASPEGAEAEARKAFGISKEETPEGLLETLGYIAAPVAWEIGKYHAAAAITKGGPLFRFHMGLLDASEAIRRGDPNVGGAFLHGQVAQMFLGGVSQLTRLPRALLTAAFFGGIPAARAGVEVGMKEGAQAGAEAAFQVATHPDTVANTLVMTLLGQKHDGVKAEDIVRYAGEVGKNLRYAVDSLMPEPRERIPQLMRTMRQIYGWGTMTWGVEEQRNPVTNGLIRPPMVIVRTPQGAHIQASILTGEAMESGHPGFISVVPSVRSALYMPFGSKRFQYAEGQVMFHSDPVFLIDLLSLNPGYVYDGRALVEGPEQRMGFLQVRGIPLEPTTPESFREAAFHEAAHIYLRNATPQEAASEFRQLAPQIIFRDGTRVSPEEIEALAEKVESWTPDGKYVPSHRENKIWDAYEEIAIDKLARKYTDITNAPGVVKRVALFADGLLTTLLPPELRNVYRDLVRDVNVKGRLWQRPDTTMGEAFPELYGEKHLIKRIEEQNITTEHREWGNQLVAFLEGRRVDSTYGYLILDDGPIDPDVNTPEWTNRMASRLSGVVLRQEERRGPWSDFEEEQGLELPSNVLLRPLFLLKDGRVLYGDAHDYTADKFIEDSGLRELVDLAYPGKSRTDVFQWLTGAIRIAEMSQYSTSLQLPHEPDISQYSKLDRFWRNFGETHLTIAPLQTEGEWGGIRVPPAGHYFNGTVPGRQAVGMLRRAAGGTAPVMARFVSDGITGFRNKMREVASMTESVLEKTAMSDRIPENIQPDALINQLKRFGVKDEELKWTNIGELVDIAKRENRRIPKAELLDWIRTFSVDVHLTVEGGTRADAPITSEYKTDRDSLRTELVAASQSLTGEVPDARDRLLRDESAIDMATSPIPDEEYARDRLFDWKLGSSEDPTRQPMNESARAFYDQMRTWAQAATGDMTTEVREKVSRLQTWYESRNTPFPRELAEDVLDAMLESYKASGISPKGIHDARDDIKPLGYLYDSRITGATDRESAIRLIEHLRPAFEGKIDPLIVKAGMVRAINDHPIAFITRGEGRPASSEIAAASHAGGMYNQFYNPSNSPGVVPTVDKFTNLVYTFVPPSESKQRSFGSLEGAIAELHRQNLMPKETPLEIASRTPIDPSAGLPGATASFHASRVLVPDEVITMRQPPDSPHIPRIVTGLSRKTGRRMYVVFGGDRFDYGGPAHGFRTARRGAGILGWARSGFFTDPNTGEPQAVLSEVQGDWYQHISDRDVTYYDEGKKPFTVRGYRDPSQLRIMNRETLEQKYPGRVEEFPVDTYRPNMEMLKGYSDFAHDRAFTISLPDQMLADIQAAVPRSSRSEWSPDTMRMSFTVTRGYLPTAVRLLRQFTEHVLSSDAAVAVVGRYMGIRPTQALVAIRDAQMELGFFEHFLNSIKGRSEQLARNPQEMYRFSKKDVFEGLLDMDPEADERLKDVNGLKWIGTIGRFLTHRDNPYSPPEWDLKKMVKKSKQTGVVVKEDWTGNADVHREWAQSRQAFINTHGNYWFDHFEVAPTPEEAWRNLLWNISVSDADSGYWSRPSDAPWVETYKEHIWMDWARWCAETGSPYVMWQGPLAQFGRYGSDSYWFHPVAGSESYEFIPFDGAMRIDPDTGAIVRPEWRHTDYRQAPNVLRIDPMFVNMGPAASRGFVSEFLNWVNSVDENLINEWQEIRRRNTGISSVTTKQYLANRIQELKEFLDQRPELTLTDAGYMSRYAESPAAALFFGTIKGARIFRAIKRGDQYLADKTFPPIDVPQNVFDAENFGEKAAALAQQYGHAEKWENYLDPNTDISKAYRYDLRKGEGGKIEIVRVDLVGDARGTETPMGKYDTVDEAQAIADTLPMKAPVSEWLLTSSSGYGRSSGITNPEQFDALPRERQIEIAREYTNRGGERITRADVEKNLRERSIGGLKERQKRSLAKKMLSFPEGGLYDGRMDGWRKNYVDFPVGLYRKRFSRFGVDPQPVDVTNRPKFRGRPIAIRESVKKPETIPARTFTREDYATHLMAYREFIRPPMMAMPQAELEQMHSHWLSRLEQGDPMPLIQWVRQYAGPEAFRGMEQMNVPEIVEGEERTQYGVYYQARNNRWYKLAGPYDTLTEAEVQYSLMGEHERTRMGEIYRVIPNPSIAPGDPTSHVVVRSRITEQGALETSDVGAYSTVEEAQQIADRMNADYLARQSTVGKIAYGFEITPELREHLLFTSRPKFKLRDTPNVFVKPAEMEELKEFRDLIDPDAHPELIVKGKVLGINLDKVQTTEDLKRAISATAKIYDELIDKARRYTRSHTLTKKTAAMLGMTVDDLMARREGQAFNAEELHAAFNLSVAGARVLGEASKAYNDTPSPENEARFLQALGLQRSLQEQFGGARAEAGRSLDILKVMAAGEGKYLSTVGEALSRHGNASPAVMARMITKLPSVEQMSRFVAQAERATTADVLLEIWINSLLSGPQTHAANFIGNMLTLMNAPVERAFAGVGRAIAGGEGVQVGEAGAMLSGLFSGLREALQITAKNLDAGLPEALAGVRGAAGEDLSKIDVRRQGAISGTALNVTGTAGRLLDILGKIVRTPGGVLYASDQFFKLVNFRMELNALAYRTATEEGLEGKARTDRIRDILTGQDEVAFNQLINDANSWADYQTFTNALSPGGTALLRWANANPWARLVVPFVRTPINIFHYALDRTPLLNLTQKRMWADIRAGGARADMAIGKISTSAMLLATITGMALSNMISGYGPADKELRRQLMATGWQPWSVRIGNRWYAYDRLDPVGAVLGAGATFAEMWSELPEAEVESLALMGAIAFSRAMVSKTYLTGIARVVDAISDPQASAPSVFRSYVGSTVPAFLSQADRSMFDNQIRELWTYSDVLKDRIPGLSDTLPPKRDIFGHPQYYSGSLGPDYLSPIRVSEDKSYPAMQEMIDHKVRVSPPDKWIYGSKPTGVFGPTTRKERAGEGVALTPEQYDRLSQLRGSMAESLVIQAMSDPEYQRYTDGPDGGKAAILRRAFSIATREAKRELLRENPELLGKVTERMQDRRRRRMPVDLEIVEE